MLLWFASWVIAIDGRVRGLLSAVGPNLVSWSEGLFVEEAQRHRAENAAARARTERPPAPIERTLTPAERAVLHEVTAPPPSTSPPPSTADPSAPVSGHLQIATLLGVRTVCILGEPQLIMDVHVGESGAHRSVTEDEWERLARGGVALLPWKHIVRLRVAVRTGMGGNA